MSGKLKIWSTIKGLSSVKKYLFPSETESEDENAYGWDSDWGWEDLDLEDDEKDGDGSWFSACHSSISPTGELMVFAREKRMIILSYKFDEDKDAPASMKVHYSGEPANMYEDDAITSVLCVPLYSPRQSNHGAPDWTCVILGFASGYIRFYSDNGGEILSQRLHNTAVTRLSLQTYEPPSPGICGEQNEELMVLFDNVLACVEGFSLFQTLRACRNHLARATAGSAVPMSAPPLSLRKWELKQQDGISDQINLGLKTPNTFDHLVTASLLGGPYATVQPVAPTHCVYAAVGRRPFLGFYFASEGGWQPMLTDVARLVASKVKTAIVSTALSWWGSSSRSSTTSSSNDDNERKLTQAVTLAVRFGLPDKRREAVTMAMSPNRRVSAVVDTFGRVLLIDMARGEAVRMWKGYRDAQVAWMEGEEDATKERPSRSVSFLVIYAPRRGILEVWAAEQGPRIAAFNVGKSGRLFPIDYKMLGLNATTYRHVIGQRHNQPLFTAFFLDREGHLSLLDVPFHLCLTDRSSHRAHDYHLLKKLRLLMRDSNSATADEFLLNSIMSIVREFRLVGFLEQAVERVLHTKYLTVPLLEQIFKEIAKELESDQFCKMSPAVDKQRLILYSHTVLSLIETYAAIQTFSFLDEEEGLTGAAASSPSKTTAELLRPHLPDDWGDEAIARLAKVLDFNTAFARGQRSEQRPGSTPTRSTDVSVIQFLDWFYTQFQGKKEQGALQREVLINPDMTPDRLTDMGSFFFRSHLIGYTTGEDLLSCMQKSCIPREAYLSAFLAFYLAEDRPFLVHLDWLAALLQQLLHFRAKEGLASAEELCRLFASLERGLKASRVRGAPVLLASAAVSVLQSEIRAREKTDQEGVTSLISLLPQWLHLLRRTEDALSLQLLLAHQPVGSDDPALTDLPPGLEVSKLPTLTSSSSHHSHETGNSSGPGGGGSGADLSVSQDRLTEGGRGFVTELTARWATKWRLTLADLQCLYFVLGQGEKELEDGQERMETDQVAQELEEEEAEVTTEALFCCLYDHFPMALEMDALLANVAWEYIFLWSKDVEDVRLLTAAIDCLQHLGPAGALVCHGVASMAWHMHLQKSVQCAAYLIEKVGGKVPKDRLCRKDTSMSQACLRQFLHGAFRFMETFKQANCDADVVPAFLMDQSWRSGVDGRLSLVELAIDQPVTNYGLLLHHSVLLFCLDAIVTYDLRGFKPFSLFDTKGVNAFFKSMTSHPLLPGATVDTPVLNQRTKFCSRLLEAAVVALPSSESTHDFFRDTLVNQVASQLSLETDWARREHIALLYSHGMDARAEEYLSSVHDLTVMASQLLLTAGQRCAHLVFPLDGPMNLKRMSLMPPVLEGYFKTSNHKDLAQPNVPMVATKRLVSLVIQMMTDDHPEMHRAHLMSDTLDRFVNMTEEM